MGFFNGMDTTNNVVGNISLSDNDLEIGRASCRERVSDKV